jgi:hypothetical protein
MVTTVPVRLTQLSYALPIDCHKTCIVMIGTLSLVGKIHLSTFMLRVVTPHDVIMISHVYIMPFNTCDPHSSSAGGRHLDSGPLVCCKHRILNIKLPGSVC